VILLSGRHSIFFACCFCIFICTFRNCKEKRRSLFNVLPWIFVNFSTIKEKTKWLGKQVKIKNEKDLETNRKWNSSRFLSVLFYVLILSCNKHCWTILSVKCKSKNLLSPGRQTSPWSRQPPRPPRWRCRRSRCWWTRMAIRW
jgi:hypothetical protein